MFPHKNSVLVITLVALFSVSSWLLIIGRADPFSSTIWPQVAFYISLFFSIASVLTIVGYLLRYAMYRSQVYFSHLTTALRQGVTLSLCICFMLYLMHLKIINWWNGLLILCIFILLEIFFLSREK